MPYVWPALLLPGFVTSNGVPIRFASALIDSKPTRVPSSKTSYPRQNRRGALVDGLEQVRRATEPIRYAEWRPEP